MRIFSDKSLLAKGQPHVVMLYPFWGKNPEDPQDPNSGRFDSYTEEGKAIFTMTSLEDAEIAVLPIAWEHALLDDESLELAERFIAFMREAGKPVVIFFHHDSVAPVSCEGATVFRTSLLASRRNASEFVIPSWSEDFVERYTGSSLPLREKAEKPRVGFCGYAGRPDSRARDPLRKTAYRIRHPLASRTPKGLQVRSRALRWLSGSALVETNFLLRAEFLGGIQVGNAADFNRIRREYVENMIDSDYILCARGGGNFSYRLYETLSCGRIPVFVNTDCCLPFEDVIDWRSLCVWVEEKDLRHIAERVATHYAGLTDQQFREHQKQCRRIWEDYLSPLGFFTNLHSHFPGEY